MPYPPGATHAVLYRNVFGGAAAFQSAAIVPFSADTTSGGRFAPEVDLELLYALSWGATQSAARVQTPLILQTSSLHLRPFTVAATLPTDANIADFHLDPPQFRRFEAVDVQQSAGGAETDNCILIFGTKSYTKVSGRKIRTRFTSATALSAGAWTRVPIVPDESLPALRFAIVGMEVFSATGFLARLDIPGNPWRPGVPVVNALTSRLGYQLYNEWPGVLGYFSNVALPSLEIFATAADATQQVWLDLIPTGPAA